VPGAASPFTFSTALDLSSLTSPGFFIGSATSLRFTSTASIVLPSTATSYSFNAYKGGAVQIDFALADSATLGPRAVVIGDPNAFNATVGANGNRSAVLLNGTNTYTGGTKLNTGVLKLGNSQALGTGALTVQPTSGGDSIRPALQSSIVGLSLANAVALGSDLEIGGANDLTLSGVISGTGELYKLDNNALTLSGHNTWNGGTYIQQGAVTFTQADSVGTGPLKFGLITTAVAPTANFLTSSTVNGIFGDSGSDRVNLGATTLTINQPFDSVYLGTFGGSGGTLVFQGSGTRLRLAGDSSASLANTGTTINTGIAVVAANNLAFGPATNPITLNGGKLVAAAGVSLGNPITITSGKLGGNGQFTLASALTIGSGAILAPGDGGTGALTFNGSAIASGPTLALASGGQLNWQVMDATNASGGWDTLTVNGTLAFTATPLAPFNLKLITISSDGANGLAGNFSSSLSYSWPIFTATSITGFNASAFTFDLSGFSNSTGIGFFNLSLNPAGTSVLLNFTPVPEPSSYALFALGGATLFAALRRRRA